MLTLGIRVAAERAELVLAELLSLVPSGVQERQLDDDTVEYLIFGKAAELPAMVDIEAAAGTALVDVARGEIEDDWAQRWRSFHKPVSVGSGRLRVRPPWEAADSGAEIELVIDPGQAFGTGAHYTTRMCLELMLSLADDPQLAGSGVVDIGCGSGVLAIAAARLGFTPVLGLDHEHESVRATLENAAVNGVQLKARHWDLLYDGLPPAAPLVFANLLRPLLLRIAADGFDGQLPLAMIASGLLAEEADEIASAFAHLGLQETQRLHGGEWAALLLRSGH
jgi:ribosomal protein L11 methyltransferase